MTDILQELETLAPALPAAVERRKLGDRLNKAVETLKAAPQQVARLEALLALAAETDFERQPQNHEIADEARFAASTLGKDLTGFQGADQLRSAVTYYEDVLLKSALLNLDRAIKNHWRGIVSERFKSLSGIGELLSGIDATSALGRRMNDCWRRAQKSTEIVAPVELLTRARELMKEHTELKAEQFDGAVGGAVGDFLNAVAEQRATLALVTPEVRTWLERNNALARFRIAPV